MADFKMNFLLIFLLVVICAIDLFIYDIFCKSGLPNHLKAMRQWPQFLLICCPGGCIIFSLYLSIIYRNPPKL